MIEIRFFSDQRVSVIVCSTKYKMANGKHTTQTLL